MVNADAINHNETSRRKKEVEVEGKKKKMTRNYLAFEAMNGSGLFNYDCGGGGGHGGPFQRKKPRASVHRNNLSCVI